MEDKLKKLDLNKIKHSGFLVFDTKEKMLNYIKKTSFSDRCHDYEMTIVYRKRKWIVSWR